MSSSEQSVKLSFILSISAFVICRHLSSGSNHGYLLSCVGTLVSSVVISVHVEIRGISQGSIGLSNAISSIYQHHIFYILFATNAPYLVLMGDFLTTDFQFLSSARMGKLPPWGFLPINGRLVYITCFSPF